jgi:hypothetical protein
MAAGDGDEGGVWSTDLVLVYRLWSMVYGFEKRSRGWTPRYDGRVDARLYSF